jgi:hypothetical protein
MTNRRRVQRARRTPISDACIEAFREWRKLNDACECHERDCNICARLLLLEKTIGEELQLKPWQRGFTHDPHLMDFLTAASSEVPT